jgi:hypothetical protein
MVTEKTAGFRLGERVAIRASDLQVGQTLHRLWQIMPFVAETVNKLGLMQR